MKDNDRADKSEARADKSEKRADESAHRANKSDIRMDHLEQKSAADKFVTEQQVINMAGYIESLAKAVNRVADEVHRLFQARKRENQLLVIGAILVFGFGVVFLLGFLKTFENQATLKEQGRIIEAVTGCTTKDTKQECEDKQEKRSKEEGLTRLKAVDCIGRSHRDGDPKHVVEQKCFPPPPTKPAPALPPPPKEAP